jgi:hypothetical protein
MKRPNLYYLCPLAGSRLRSDHRAFYQEIAVGNDAADDSKFSTLLQWEPVFT